MRAVLALALFVSACGPPPPVPCCGRKANVARGTVYSGTIASTDGGTSTEVRVTLSSSGNATVTFLRDGREIVQGFSAIETFQP